MVFYINVNFINTYLCCAEEPLFINPDVKHVRVSEENMEGGTIYTIELSRSLTSSETVEQVVLIGTNSDDFLVNQDTLEVSTAAEIQPGRYFFDAAVVINNNILTGAVVVDIISDGKCCKIFLKVIVS